MTIKSFKNFRSKKSQLDCYHKYCQLLFLQPTFPEFIKIKMDRIGRTSRIFCNRLRLLQDRNPSYLSSKARSTM